MKPEPPRDAAYRVLAKTLRKPRMQNVSEEALRDLILEAMLQRGYLDASIEHAKKLVKL